MAEFATRGSYAQSKGVAIRPFSKPVPVRHIGAVWRKSTPRGAALTAVAKVIKEGRNGVMPPMAAAVGTSEDVRNVANYVLSLSGSPHNAVAAQLGKPKFGTCAACHGLDGKGNKAIGAPNLTDRIWLHGWGEQAVVNAITNGINNAMPAQGRLLTPDQVQVLSAYVLSLSRPTAVAAAK